MVNAADHLQFGGVRPLIALGSLSAQDLLAIGLFAIKRLKGEDLQVWPARGIRDYRLLIAVQRVRLVLLKTSRLRLLHACEIKGVYFPRVVGLRLTAFGVVDDA